MKLKRFICLGPLAATTFVLAFPDSLKLFVQRPYLSEVGLEVGGVDMFNVRQGNRRDISGGWGLMNAGGGGGCMGLKARSDDRGL